MQLSIITVTWNSEKHIQKLLASVALACANVSYEHIVVDNASSDNTCNLLNEFPHIKLIRNQTNIGFSKANNIGAAMANGEFMLFLNPDMELVGGGSVSAWLQWMKENPRVGISGCKLINQDGAFNSAAAPRRFPTVFDQLMIILKIPHLFPGVLNKYLYSGFNPEIAQKVDSVRGSAMLMRRDLYQKMSFAFDPRYYLWYEDVDTCREAYKNGYEVWYTPIFSAKDLVGTSFKKRNFFWKQLQIIKSLYKYFSKWGFRA